LSYGTLVRKLRTRSILYMLGHFLGFIIIALADEEFAPRRQMPCLKCALATEYTLTRIHTRSDTL